MIPPAFKHRGPAESRQAGASQGEVLKRPQEAAFHIFPKIPQFLGEKNLERDKALYLQRILATQLKKQANNN